MERTDGEARRDSRHATLRFWQSARGYWGKGGDRRAWLLTVAMGAVVLVSLGITYGLNLWNRHFFDALGARAAAPVFSQALIFPAWIAAYLCVCVFAMWARMTMQRTWRAYVNRHILDRWLTRFRYYQLELIGGDHRNAEHRINDDLRIATEMPVDFVSGFLTAILSAIAFFAVLWSVGGPLTIPFDGATWSVPGFMLFAAAAYAVVVNGVMLIMTRRLIPLTQAKNQSEAEYRYALARVRDNAECIALLRGAGAERGSVDRSFGAVLERWTALVAQQMRAVVVSQGHAQLCGVVPLLLCARRYLNGSMSLGEMMQIASAFVIVQSALTWLVENYTRIAEWTASVRRVGQLLLAIDEIETMERAAAIGVAHEDQASDGLALRDVTIRFKDGVPAVCGVNAGLRRGERVLLMGDSGSGKSLLVRALGGIWPWGGGTIVRAAGTDIAVVPQRPYVPTGSLRRAAVYPRSINDIQKEHVVGALAAVGLGRFLPRLDDDLPWATTLSEGEKQRLAMARLLLHRPDVIVLDEATSALDTKAQAEMMTLITDRLPAATILSIGHRSELAAFHDRQLTLAASPFGARLVGEDGRVRGASADRTVADRTVSVA